MAPHHHGDDYFIYPIDLAFIDHHECITQIMLHSINKEILWKIYIKSPFVWVTVFKAAHTERFAD